MAQQTAVERLLEQLDTEEIYVPFKIIEEAKQMEKVQHGDTWDEAIKAHEKRGNVIARSICDFDDYYNETYNQNK